MGAPLDPRPLVLLVDDDARSVFVLTKPLDDSDLVQRLTAALGPVGAV